MTKPSHAELARVVREHAGRLAASLVPLVGDFAAAEDLVQDAVEAALTHWPVEGIPDRPDGWLYTVARRRGLDLLRREDRHRDKLALVAWPTEPEPDDRLRLIFTCCHPALPRAAQVALTLRVVCGLTTDQIAKAFLVPDSPVALRYVSGPAAALSEVDMLADELDGYHLLHATRAELLRELGRAADARAADERALSLATNPAELSLLRQRLSWT